MTTISFTSTELLTPKRFDTEVAKSILKNGLKVDGKEYVVCVINHSFKAFDLDGQINQKIADLLNTPGHRAGSGSFAEHVDVMRPLWAPLKAEQQALKFLGKPNDQKSFHTESQVPTKSINFEVERGLSSNVKPSSPISNVESTNMTTISFISTELLTPKRFDTKVAESILKNGLKVDGKEYVVCVINNSFKAFDLDGQINQKIADLLNTPGHRAGSGSSFAEYVEVMRPLWAPLKAEQQALKFLGKPNDQKSFHTESQVPTKSINFEVERGLSSNVKPSSPISNVESTKMPNGDEIAETLASEASFTIATDKKPIVATYGCRDGGVVLGGYDPTNKIAFIVNFSNENHVYNSRSLLLNNITKLVKQKITTPIQLHLRGNGPQSMDTISAIQLWIMRNNDLPMEIASKDISSGQEKSLSIDSRNGQISDYNPESNPERRELDIMASLSRSIAPTIEIVYSPT